MKSINRDIHRENRLENATSAPDGLHGAALIASLAAQMPPTPGVYQMVDKDETILYIGKANNLRKRVVSYSRIANHGNRIARMITRVRDLRYTLTRTETDALLLEASLIKKHHPKYNVLLQDNKSFPYILLAHDHPAPQILKHRGKHSRKGDYFGPFASVRAVNQTLRMLQSAFLLRS
ncbi:MAG: GIY-YIG nuclease family protein, partial [Hyphomicrobiales bacterium]|nr:GIY-YIG nuclease family protein [Hyphomicrobiales bacterium]